jgi:hypothetical protein
MSLSVYTFAPHLLIHQSDFQNMNLREKDVGEFYKFFQLLDSDQDGFIEYFELFKFLELETTKFTIHIFDIYDVDKVGMTLSSLSPLPRPPRCLSQPLKG